ncbi:MAG: glycosyltransferase family 9 protein, partial [Anaerolineales bacterium]|nr:glycosyltransferase family 9 protein [Anaerolineales bacterium]
MLPEPWRAVRRLLVVRLDNAGDVVLLSPALRALRAALPDAAITLLASPAGSQVAPLLPWVDAVLTHRAVWQDLAAGPPDPQHVHALVDTLRRARFDAAVLFTSFSQSPYPPAMACYLAGIPLRLGQSALFGGGILSTCIQPPPDVYHQADRNLHLLAAAGFPIPDPHLALHVPNAVQAAADALLRRRGVDPAAPFILVAPGASCAARRYPPRRFAAALRLLAAQTPLPIVVTGSAREAAHVRAALPADPHGRFTSLLGDTSLP